MMSRSTGDLNGAINTEEIDENNQVNIFYYTLSILYIAYITFLLMMMYYCMIM